MTEHVKVRRILPRRKLLIYAPFSLNGRGPGQTCVWIASELPATEYQTELFVPRSRINVPGEVEVRSALPAGGKHVPWKVVGRLGTAQLDRVFARALRSADPSRTVAYFWPDPPASLVALCRDLGIPTVREMINTACATSKPILDRAYDQEGFARAHGISDRRVANETAELRLHDYFFASNTLVEQSLIDVGIARAQVLSTSFGWSEARFEREESGCDLRSGSAHSGVRFIFVGSLDVRKGLPDLLRAWQTANIAGGELLLVGGVSDEVRRLLDDQSHSHVRVIGYSSQLSQLFRSSDVFVFPSLEEGGPQVTYEAAAFGLPLLTTPMGAGRIVVDGETGLLVPAGDVGALASAMVKLARSAELRVSLGNTARGSARRYTYHEVALDRHRYFMRIFDT